MSVLAYSTCGIQFRLNNERDSEHEYSERSIIELRLSDSQVLSLRGVDIEHNRTEIFNLPIKDRHQYQFGLSSNQPDQINHANGTYHLRLNAESRNQFHQIFCAIIETLFPENSSPTTSSSSLYNTLSQTKTARSSTFHSEPPREKRAPVRDPVNCNPKDILIDVHHLSKFIQQGRTDDAARLAKQFISQGIRLEAKPLKHHLNEQDFQINIQLDGNEYSINQTGGTIPMYVYPSTTVRELRAVFEAAYQYPPANQYFFVNGKIAHDQSTMHDLNVGPNSLFVLFLLAHTKQFKAQGPWKCSACTAQNDQNNLRCRICSANRVE